MSLFVVYKKPSGSSRQDKSNEGGYFDDITNQIAALYDTNDICIIGDKNCWIANRQEVYFAENDAEEGALSEFMFNI